MRKKKHEFLVCQTHLGLASHIRTTIQTLPYRTLCGLWVDEDGGFFKDVKCSRCKQLRAAHEKKKTRR